MLNAETAALIMMSGDSHDWDFGALSVTDSGYYGLSSVGVNVQFNKVGGTFSQSGTYYAADVGADGYDPVTVDVSELEQQIETLTQTITELQEKVDECSECQQEAAAAIANYTGTTPQDCQGVVDGINAIGEKIGFTFPSGTTYADIAEIVGGESRATSPSYSDYYLEWFYLPYTGNPYSPSEWYEPGGIDYNFYFAAYYILRAKDGTRIEICGTYTTWPNVSVELLEHSFDPATGTAVVREKWDPYDNIIQRETFSQLAGFGDGTEDITVTN